MPPYGSVAENETESYSLYPNPANDYITFTETTSETSQISIMNIHGQLMNIQVRNKKIDVSGLPDGVYLVKIDNKSAKIVVKH